MSIFSLVLSFTVDGQGFGLHIAEGYTQNSKGLEVRGVFVKEIVAGSPADNCGRLVIIIIIIIIIIIYIILHVLYRVKESDMIIDIAGSSMLGASLEDAARVLKQSGNIVRSVIILYNYNNL